jgi:hypothetical protein
MSIRALALVFVIACGGSPKHAADPAPGRTEPVAKPAAPTCAQVLEHLETLPDRNKWADVGVASRCDAEAWSDDARGCFGAVQSNADFQRCKAQVGPSQPQAVAAPRDDAKPAPVERAMKKDDAKPHTRGPVKKGTQDADPCEGGQ